MKQRRAHRRLNRGIVATGILAFALAACSFKADYADTEYRCDQSGECPSGHGCFDGVCLASPPDDVPAGECGTLAAAVQDFTDITPLDENLWFSWVDVPVDMTVADGQLRFSIPADADNVGAAFGTQPVYALKDSAATVEVIDLSVDDTVFVTLDLEDQDGRHLHLYHDSGSLVMELDDLASSMQVAFIDYNPVEHRFWRIHEQDGSLYWSTSADGRNYTEHASLPSDVIGPWVGSHVEIWKSAPGQVPGTVVFDNLNAGRPPASFCPSASLVDDFDDGVTSSDWYISDSGVCTVSERDGRLGFEFPEAVSGSCAYESRTVYDMSASSVTVEGPLADVLGIEHCLKIYLADGQDIEFELRDGDLRGEKSLAGVSDTVFRVPYDHAIHRFWRMRGDGGSIYWELSSDGVEWTVMASHHTPPAPLDYVMISLIGDADLGQAQSVGAAFDNLNRL